MSLLFKRLIMTFIRIVAVMILISSQSFAAIYYVDKNHPQANDNNDGSEGTPWATIQKAANTLIAGDKVYVKAGIYTEFYSGNPDTGVTAIKPQNSGTAAAKITYEAYPGDSVVIDQNGQAMGFFISGKSHIIIRGFEIRNIDVSGIETKADASDILIEKNHIHNVTGNFGQNVAGIRFDLVTRPIARNNEIHNISVGGAKSGNASAIQSYGLRDGLIENNELYDTGNAFFHKKSAGVTGALFQKNDVYDVDKGIWYDISGAGDPQHVDQRVCQNVFRNAREFIVMNDNTVPTQHEGVHIWNNTFVKGSRTSTGIYLGFSRDVNIYNNIFLGNFSQGTIRTKNQPVDFAYVNHNDYHESDLFMLNVYDADAATYNNLSSWQSAENHDLDSATVDPGMVDENANNYRLLANSPLLNAGRDGVTVGAYITNNDVIGRYERKPRIVEDVIVQ